jgi:hypothetical protein
VSWRKEKPIPEMCTGCVRCQSRMFHCDVIKEPRYIYKHRGTCFARVDARRAAEIEEEIRANTGAV